MTSAAPTSTSVDTRRTALASAVPVPKPVASSALSRPAPASQPLVASAPTHPAPAPQPLAPQPPAALDGDWPTLDELSLRYLHRVIEHSRGNKTKAAEVLGIDRRTVSRILSKASRQGKPPTMQTANRK